MKGTRPLDNHEIRKIYESFTGDYEKRNRGLFLLGVSVGGRISELLGLRVSDVWQNETPVTDLLFQRNIVKGGEVSRTVPVNSDGRSAVSWNWLIINWFGLVKCLRTSGFFLLGLPKGIDQYTAKLPTRL